MGSPLPSEGLQKDQKPALKERDSQADGAGDALRTTIQGLERAEHDQCPNRLDGQEERWVAAVAIDEEKADRILLAIANQVARADNQISVVDRDGSDINQDRGEQGIPDPPKHRNK